MSIITMTDGTTITADDVRIHDNGWVYIHGYNPKPEPAGALTNEQSIPAHAIRSIDWRKSAA